MTQTELKVRITKIMHELGIPAHIKGHAYIREALMFTVEDPSLINRITKGLYPKVAEKCQTTATRAERSIRHAIETAWDRGDLDTLQKFFGYTVSSSKGKPTNSEFLALVTDKILLEVECNG